MHAIIQAPDNMGIKRLRFDPAEGLLIKAKIESVTINGENIDFEAENALQKKEGNDIFINPDPIYELKLPQHIANLGQMNVEIQGTISRLTDNEIGDVVTEFMYRSRDDKNEIAEKYRVSVLHAEEMLTSKKELERNYEIISCELDKALLDKRSLEKECKSISDELNKALEYTAGLEKENVSVSNELSKVSEAMKDLAENHNMISDELNCIKSSHWYKIWRKYMKMRGRRQESE